VHLRTTVRLDAPFSGYVIVGSLGAGRFLVDGEVVAETPGDAARDDVATPLELAAGSHELRARVAVGWAGGALSLRLVDASLRAPTTLRVLRPTSAESGPPPPPVALTLSTRAEPEGYLLTAQARLGATGTGLPLPLRAKLLLSGSVARSRGQPLRAEVPLGTLDLGHPQAEQRLPVRPGGDGSVQLTAQVLGPRGEVLGDGELVRSFRSEHHRLLAEAERTLRQVVRVPRVPQATVWALEASVEEARDLLDRGDPDHRYRRRLLRGLVGDLRQAARGRDPLARRRGPMQRAYRSPLDGRLHRYALYVPPGYNPRWSFPLVVGLHGMASTERLCLRRLFGFDVQPEQTRAQAEREQLKFPNIGALVVCPGGFGDVGYRYPGETDVLRVIAEVSSLYRVDPRRVSLTGPSMGGIATFALATRYPDRFSGAAALCGQADVRQYREIDGFPLAPWESWFVQRQSPIDWAANGVHLPLLVVHGTKDRTPAAHSERFVRRYQRLGYKVEFRTPDLGHNVWAETYADGAVLQRLRKLRRPKRPHRAVLVSADYRHRHADWVSIERFVGGRGMGSVRARLGDRKARRIRVRTDGVLAFSLHLGDAGFPSRGATVATEVDGTTLQLRGGATRYLERAEGTQDGPWLEAKGPPDLEGLKRPGLAGPIDDLRYEPVLFVYGTADPSQTAVNRRRAEEDARSFWGSRQDYPVLADAALSAEQARGHHLALYGGPTSNEVLAPLADRLPIRFEPGAVVAGGRRYEGPDVGAVFIYPNPDHPDRYVLVQAGTTIVGTLHGHHLPRYLPDYLIYDRRIVGRRHRRILQGREVLEGGFFDERWRLPPAPTPPPAAPRPPR